MYCRNCGNKIDENKNFCGKCGTKLKEEKENAVYIIPDNIDAATFINNSKNNQNVQNINNNDNIYHVDNIEYCKKANILCIISLMLVFVPVLIFLILVNVYGWVDELKIIFSIMFITPLIGFVISIYAAIKYKESNFVKGLLKFYVLLIIIGIIALIITLIKCLDACGRMG